MLAAVGTSRGASFSHCRTSVGMWIFTPPQNSNARAEALQRWQAAARWQQRACVYHCSCVRKTIPHIQQICYQLIESAARIRNHHPHFHGSHPDTHSTAVCDWRLLTVRWEVKPTFMWSTNLVNNPPINFPTHTASIILTGSEN